MTSSIYPVDFVAKSPTINANDDIFSTPITITPEMVRPGGGGVLRLWFSFALAGTTTVSVFDGTGTTLIGNLNPDNSFEIFSNGYYRFDIDVEANDTINLQAGADITAINRLRAHLVQFGA